MTTEQNCENYTSYYEAPEGKLSAEAYANAELVRQEIQGKGYCLVKKRHSLECYHATGALLGRILEVDDIRLRSDAKVYAYSKDVIPLHNDGIEGDIVSLYCVKQNQKGAVGTWIVDVRNLLEALPEDVLQYLERTTFTRGHGERAQTFNVLERSEESFKLYYTPWFFPKPTSTEKQILYKQFLDYVTARTETHSSIACPEPGQALFFDNHQFLHGRARVMPGSERCLKRLWIDSSANKGV